MDSRRHLASQARNSQEKQWKNRPSISMRATQPGSSYSARAKAAIASRIACGCSSGTAWPALGITMTVSRSPSAAFNTPANLRGATVSFSACRFRMRAVVSKFKCALRGCCTVRECKGRSKARFPGGLEAEPTLELFRCRILQSRWACSSAG
jgi:hypothetical protein